jgi:hypothetical protein
MTIETIIEEALSLSEDAIGYFVSRRLSELFPLLSVIEGQESGFDPMEHASDGKAEVTPALSLHNQICTVWYGAEHALSERVENGLFDVRWRGESLQVLLLTWSEGGCRGRHHWILANSKQVAETYFKEVCDWCSEVRGEVLVFDSGYWYKSEELYQEIQSATFDNLILQGDLKEQIQSDLKRFFASRGLYERHGIPWKRGILLIGPPGNGKTHTVKALANWLAKPCLYVKSFAHRYRTEQDCMRDVFDRARKTNPCLLVMEDLDSLLNARNRSFFLNELDGFASNTGVVVLATTNHPERLDTAILERPSRFDRKYHFELPGVAERLAYIRTWTRGWGSELQLKETGAEQVAGATEGFSFAYMKELFLSSMMRWIDEGAERGMDAIMLNQVTALREQMSAACYVETVPPQESEEEEDETLDDQV